MKLTFVNKTVSQSTIAATSQLAAPIPTLKPTLKSNSEIPERARLLLAVPNLARSSDQDFAKEDLTDDQSTPCKPQSAAGRIPLSPAESTVFQEGIRHLKVSFVSLVGGSLFWRLFLGSSVAVFIGAATLACMNPTRTISTPDARIARPLTPSKTVASSPRAATVEPPKIELTVNASDQNPGQEPAQYDDPFVPENQVQPKYIHALHLATQDGPPESGIIRQVTRRRSLSSRPASLDGSIETNDETTTLPSLTPLRNHERFRPRDR